MQCFDYIINDKLSILGCHELQDDPDFQEYMEGVKRAMGSVDENLIGIAIFNYLYFHKKEAAET